MSDMQDNTGRPPGGDPAATGAQGGTAAGSTTPAGAGQPVTGQPAASQPRPAPATMAQPAAGPGGTSQATMDGDTAQAATGRQYVPRPAPGYDDARTYEARHADDAGLQRPSGAAMGLTIMAAVFMMVAGLLNFFAGLAAIIRGTFLVVLPHYAFSLSPHGWGWLNVVTGAIVFVAGAALFAGRTWARVLAVAIAAMSIVANFVALPYYPVWAIVVIALDAFVIWALLTPRNALFR